MEIRNRIFRIYYRCCNKTIRSSAAAVVLLIFSIVTEGGFFIESNTELLVSGSTGLELSANFSKKCYLIYDIAIFHKRLHSRFFTSGGSGSGRFNGGIILRNDPIFSRNDKAGDGARIDL